MIYIDPHFSESETGLFEYSVSPNPSRFLRAYFTLIGQMAQSIVLG